MAVPTAAFDAFQACAKERGVDVHAVGTFTECEGVEVLDVSGTPLQFDRKGWTHF